MFQTLSHLIISHVPTQVCYRGCVPGSIGAKFRYCNHSLTLEERLDALGEELTFDEKVMIMKAHAHGGCRRIGLPGYEFDSDGLHGYAGPCRNGSKLSCPTTFPAPPTLGNAWNMSAIEAMGVVISTEHRAWHNSEGNRNLSSSDTLGGESGDTAGTSGQTLEHVGVNVWGPTLNGDLCTPCSTILTFSEAVVELCVCARACVCVRAFCHLVARLQLIVIRDGVGTTSRPQKTRG